MRPPARVAGLTSARRPRAVYLPEPVEALTLCAAATCAVKITHVGHVPSRLVRVGQDYGDGG
jgi:hypothetical protein